VAKQVSLSEYAGDGGFDRYMDVIRENQDFEFLRMIAIHIAMERGRVTADDLREYCENYNIEIRKDRRIYGAVLAHLQREGFLRKAGYVPSKVPTSHGRPIAEFVLARGFRSFSRRF